MPDFGPRWQLLDPKPLGRGGQAHAYLVRDTQAPDAVPQFVAKILSGPNYTADSPRWKRLEEEIQVARRFNHPHVVRLVDAGHSTGPSGYPFFVMPLYEGGSLDEEKRQRFRSPVEIFDFFARICDGVAYIHTQGIVHRDLKPLNIFLDGTGYPVIGDFGLCFRFDAESLTELMEVATARWFGAPELRNGHLESVTPAADLYSLGKLLYWLFTGQVYDREEQDYGTEERRLATVLGQMGAIDPVMGFVNDRLIHAGAFANDLITQVVRYQPSERLQSANMLAAKVRRVMARFEAGGRPLDVSEQIPQRCSWCGTGGYRPLVPLPPREQRLAPPDPTLLPYQQPDPYQSMRAEAEHKLSWKPSGGAAPLILLCQHCGHQQIFRLDLVPEAIRNWA